ncbi:hypothetical protein T484DRAFT_1905747, partial [Baffinella frigidus]
MTVLLKYGMSPFRYARLYRPLVNARVTGHADAEANCYPPPPTLEDLAPKGAGEGGGEDAVMGEDGQAGRGEMEVVMLGTAASCTTGKYRNVSGILVNHLAEGKGGILLDAGEGATREPVSGILVSHLAEGKGGILLDAGEEGRGGILLDAEEGTLGQIHARYGPEKAREVLESLRCVWISHMHADHHIGLLRVLSHRARLPGGGGKPLTVIGPVPLRKWLNAYKTVEAIEFEFVSNAKLGASAQWTGADPEKLLADT